MTDLEREMSMLSGLNLNAQPVQQDFNQPQMVQQPVQQMVQPQVQPTQQMVQQPVQSVVPQPQMVQQPVMPQPMVQQPGMLNLDVAQKETEDMSTFISVEMGKKVSTAVIEKFKAQKDEKKRIVLMMPFAGVPGKELAAYAVKRHYTEDLGSFVCFNGECCQYESRADVRYLFPVIEIPIIQGDVNRVIPANIGGQLKLKLLVAGNELYSTLCDVFANHNNSFDGYDLVLTCTEQQYQKFSVQPTMSSFRDQFPDDFRRCVEKWVSVREQAYTVAARKMDRDYYIKQKGLGYNGGTTGTNVPGMDSVMQ